MLGRGLATHGLVEVVGTCAAARMSLRVRQYDALIVDVHLPDGSGLDLIPIATAKSPSIVVLVLTGSTDHETIARALQEGARYLLKPFDARHLATIAEEVRGRQEAGERRIKLTLQRWQKDLDLSDAEVELLELGARGLTRDKFAQQRRVRPDTVRKQIQTLLQKTGDDTYEGAVNSLLREAVSEPT